MELEKEIEAEEKLLACEKEKLKLDNEKEREIKIEEIEINKRITNEIENNIETLKMKRLTIEDTLNTIHNQSTNIFNQTINPLQQLSNEIQTNKNLLSKEIAYMDEIIRITMEEQMMLVEDLNSHLLHRGDYIAQKEEFDVLYEQLKRSLTLEFDYYLQSLSSINIGDEYEKYKEKTFYQEHIDNLNTDIDFLKLGFAEYSKKRDEKNAKLYREIRDIDIRLKRVNDLIKKSLNFVENHILPQITAVHYINANRLNKY